MLGGDFRVRGGNADATVLLLEQGGDSAVAANVDVATNRCGGHRVEEQTRFNRALIWKERDGAGGGRYGRLFRASRGDGNWFGGEFEALVLRDHFLARSLGVQAGEDLKRSLTRVAGWFSAFLFNGTDEIRIDSKAGAFEGH